MCTPFLPEIGKMEVFNWFHNASYLDLDVARISHMYPFDRNCGTTAVYPLLHPSHVRVN